VQLFFDVVDVGNVLRFFSKFFFVVVAN
jgi:hypothetical protein